MEYSEDNWLMLSGIQHYAFCKRQWALIHVENLWTDNLHTVEGEIFHRRAHDGPKLESRGDTLFSRDMKVFSSKLGITGICDVVEFKRTDRESAESISLNGKDGYYTVNPIEYKKGGSKVGDEDRLQLVAQVLCLEEMLCVHIQKGYLYYGETRHREKVIVDDSLKTRVQEMCSDMHFMYERKHTPKVKRTKSCNACSLKDLCLPTVQKKSVHEYIWKTLNENP